MHIQAGLTEKPTVFMMICFTADKSECHRYFLFFLFFAQYENAAVTCECVYIMLCLEKSVNNRKSFIDKNVLTRVNWVPSVWQSGFWVVCSYVSSVVFVIISLYSDGVLNRNAEYAVIDWPGSTVGEQENTDVTVNPVSPKKRLMDPFNSAGNSKLNSASVSSLLQTL